MLARYSVWVLGTFGLCASLSFSALSMQKANANGGNVKATSHKHSHDEHGPNGGEIFEIGKHEYHLELCLDEEKKTVLVYLLDSNLEKSVAVNQPHLLFNFRSQNKPQQIKLTASPLKGEAQGSSSRFSSTDSRIFNALHDAKSDCRISVRFGSKQYNVKVSHNHSHSGHSHGENSHAKKMEPSPGK